uniref:Uncharacterized protein n=1 Tax=Tanacetum cinerariifolium TaxID=118510 RepID=A0A699S5K5_TANCI|nr:hypothetical protein [Tanacetum cinerariifolium]
MIRKQVGDLSTHTTKYYSPALTQKEFANMRKVGRGFSGVETLLFEGMIVEQQVDEGNAEMNVKDVIAGVTVEGYVSAADDLKGLKHPMILLWMMYPNRGMITDMDADVAVTLKDVAADAKYVTA